MENITLLFEKKINQLPEKIKQSLFKTELFREYTGLSTTTFYRKLKKGNWTLSEVKAIESLLGAEEGIKKGKKDMLAGNFRELV